MFKLLRFICICTLLTTIFTVQPVAAQLLGIATERERPAVALTDVSQLQENQDRSGQPEISAPESYVLRGNASEHIDFAEIEMNRSSAEARATSLPIYEWVRKGVHPKAAVILVHGLFQHGESLAPIAKHLARNGYLAISIDQRGHGSWHFGKSFGQPGYSIDYAQTIDDVTDVARLLRDEHPCLPVFCLGESAGAAIAVRSAAAAPGLYDGLILCAFATRPRGFRMLWTIEDVATNMFDWDRDIKMSRYVKRFSSEDKRITSETMNDPMCRHGISLRELMHTAEFMTRTAKVARQLSPNLPILLVEGQDDQVLSPKSATKFLDHTRCECKKFVLVPRCGHVLVTTTFIKPMVMISIDDWLNQHTPGQFSTSAIVAKK